ncbi:hypothetical protein [Pseudoalteromonas denitrificans]|uniref:Uncharacterized protein n=1 Tax=Pseudoalteromonas denitrificans DSM 6059 TaxID=1123010 RepID=A0A1I1KLH9_9GAMM|nr:hypothetical protein [Pseudoalteromonas denitrificans]SFC61122.1 hypothetical protein SAMN02745724_02096 [Pseudoalteromonas denitrificans DSM 6059]
MVQNIVKESVYSKTIKNLIGSIFSMTSFQDSIYEVATEYFKYAQENEIKKNAIEQQIISDKQALEKDPKSSTLNHNIKISQKILKEFNLKQEEEKQSRLEKIKTICHDILNLCKGKDESDQNNKFARILGTIQLMTPTNTKAAINQNKKSKHLYRAVLSLLLFEQLMKDEQITNPYIQEIKNRALDEDDDEVYQNEVQIPVLMSALLLDVGSHHPDALEILKGKDGKLNEFRTLTNEERLSLLKISYHQTINYLTHGIGSAKYIGNSKEQRDVFNKNEKEKMSFILNLFKRSVDPKQGIGNIIKIPQIYVSVVLSTRSNFVYQSLPKVFLLLHKGAEKGSHSQVVVNSLQKILGIYPPGFGITYIPKNADGIDLDRFEYAIVSGIYPKNHHEPIVRIATKNLTFTSSGHDITVQPDNNLFYANCRKKLEKVSSERLNEILQKLWSNFENRTNEAQFVPNCWEPHEYFSYIKYQNLWNKNR